MGGAEKHSPAILTFKVRVRISVRVMEILKEVAHIVYFNSIKKTRFQIAGGYFRPCIWRIRSGVGLIRNQCSCWNWNWNLFTVLLPGVRKQQKRDFGKNHELVPSSP